jgi:hypothetical protein
MKRADVAQTELCKLARSVLIPVKVRLTGENASETAVVPDKALHYGVSRVFIAWCTTTRKVELRRIYWLISWMLTAKQKAKQIEETLPRSTVPGKKFRWKMSQVGRGP